MRPWIWEGVCKGREDLKEIEKESDIATLKLKKKFRSNRYKWISKRKYFNIIIVDFKKKTCTSNGFCLDIEL